MRVLLLLFVLIHTAMYVKSQNNLHVVDQKKATLYYDSCYKLHTLIKLKGKFIEYEGLIKVCKKGIDITSKNDFNNLSGFQFLIGSAYKVQLKYDSAFYYLQSSISNAQRGNQLNLEISAIQQINYLYRYVARFGEIEQNIKRLYAIKREVKDIFLANKISSILSEYYLYKGDYNQAIEILLGSISVKKQFFLQRQDYNSKIEYGLDLTNLGNLYLNLNQNQNAINYFKTSEPYFSDYTGGRVRLYINLQKAYLNLSKLDSAMYYYNKIYSSMNDYFFERAPLSATNRLFAEYYLNNKNINLAVKYSNIAYEDGIASESKETILLATQLMGNLRYKQRKYKEAIFYLKSALPNSYNYSKDTYASINLRLAQSYKSINNSSKAYYFYNSYNLIRDSIYLEKTKEGINAVEFKYKNAQKEQQIKFLSAESKAQSNQLVQQKRIQLIMVIVVILTLVIATLVYLNYRSKKKSILLLDKKNKQLDRLNNQLSIANDAKSKLFGIISHDLRSPVSQLFTFLKLQNEQPQQIEDEQNHRAKLMQSSKGLLQTMEDLLLWSKSQMEHFELSNEPVEILELLNNVKELMQPLADSKKISIEILKPQFEIINTDYNILYTILRNLLQNAVNGSFDFSVINLNADIDLDNKKSISVLNKGAVIPAERIESLMNSVNVSSKSFGYGLLIIKEMTEKINAKMTITSSEKRGTEIKISFD